jgi:hypothetical protein
MMRSPSIGSFAARLSEDRSVKQDTWTRVVFDELLWQVGNTANIYDTQTGIFTVKRTGRYHFATAVNFTLDLVAVDNPIIDLALYKNGEPFLDLHKSSTNEPMVPLSMRGAIKGAGVNGYTKEPLFAREDETLEVYVRHELGPTAHLTNFDYGMPDAPLEFDPYANHLQGMYFML